MTKIIPKKGMTLIELMITLCIICIIVPLIYSSFLNQNKLYNNEFHIYENKNNSRVILMEIEDDINNSVYASCAISETPGSDLCTASNIVKRLIYIEPIRKDLKPYLLIIKINNNGIKELGRATIIEDSCSAYKVKTDKWIIESLKEIKNCSINLNGLDSGITSSINSSINSAMLSKEFEGLNILSAYDSEIMTIKEPFQGIKNYYKAPSGRIYALLESDGKQYKALLKHIKYEKAPYRVDSYNIILDGIEDIRIEKKADFSYYIEVDCNYNNKVTTYSTLINSSKPSRRIFYE